MLYKCILFVFYNLFLNYHPPYYEITAVVCGCDVMAKAVI